MKSIVMALHLYQEESGCWPDDLMATDKINVHLLVPSAKAKIRPENCYIYIKPIGLASNSDVVLIESKDMIPDGKRLFARIDASCAILE